MSKKIDTEIFGNSVDFDICMRELEIFLNEIENYFVERRKKLKVENEYYEDLNEKHLFYYWFPNLQRRNFIITLITVVENETRSYCNLLYKYKKVPIKYSNLRGNAIDKFIIFTEKLADLQINFDQYVIENIKSLTELRNCIIHANGVIDSYYKEKIIIDFAKTFGGIKFKKGQIYLSKSFCKDALNLVSIFFNEIFKSGYFKYEKDE